MITPKEKAKELVSRFLPHTESIKIPLYHAKKCALIAVDEIIASNPTNPLKGGYIELYSDMVDEAVEFWKEVKQEIEKL